MCAINCSGGCQECERLTKIVLFHQSNESKLDRKLTTAQEKYLERGVVNAKLNAKYQALRKAVLRGDFERAKILLDKEGNL